MEHPLTSAPTPSVADWSAAPASRIRPCFPTLRAVLSLPLFHFPPSLLFSPSFLFLSLSPCITWSVTSRDWGQSWIRLSYVSERAREGNAEITESEGGKVSVCVCVAAERGRGEVFRRPADEGQKKRRGESDGERLRQRTGSSRLEGWRWGWRQGSPLKGGQKTMQMFCGASVPLIVATMCAEGHSNKPQTGSRMFATINNSSNNNTAKLLSLPTQKHTHCFIHTVYYFFKSQFCQEKHCSILMFFVTI